jgi:molecular chaperone DnaJ
MRDFYEVLGVEKTATEEQIEKAYRKLALTNHPDRNPGDDAATERFKEATNAYETLSDVKKRQMYDVGGFEMKNPQRRRDFSDIFDGMFDFARQPDDNGSNIEVEVTVSFMEAAMGCKKVISYDKRASCPSCKGTGAKDGQDIKECVACDGKGKTVQRFSGGANFIKMETTCASCRGTGKIIAAYCPNCHARGYIPTNADMEIDVPVGIADGMRICLREQGDKGLSGKTGNLYCTVRVENHPLFSRSGRDLTMVVPISYTQAVLGDKIEIPYPYGRCDLTIPRGTKSGSVFKLHGLGLSDVRFGGMGDMLVRVIVDVPKDLSEDMAKLLKKLSHLEKDDLSPGIAEFNEKVDQL